MLKSMTAYGRSTVTTAFGHFTVEIHSVNRKHLEIAPYLPREFVFLEAELRKWIGQAVSRGHVTVKVFVRFTGKTPIKVVPNLPYARQLKNAWDAIADELKVEKGFSLSLISKNEGLLLFEENWEDEEAYRQALKQAIEEALIPFVKMKEQEGKALQQDIAQRKTILKTNIDVIAKDAPEAVEKYRHKIMERLKELLPGNLENDERIIREVGLFAERVDIAEEITRFNSHLQQMHQLLNSQDVTIGKTLEFILQELFREINTIGSKCSDAHISRLVVDVKSELERIREQVQNVE